MEEMNKLCTKEAAEIIGLSESALKKDRCPKSHLYKHYNVPYYRRFGRIFYCMSDLLQWKQQHQVPD